ncbi:MAG: riboflavin synthase subunit alpha [Verrucomicrobia bacterium]|nr:MAG: riboflavin synthase subunit alpha [Verrucomicrobiota bacterium]
MFTGIIQSIATIADIHDQEGLRTFTVDFEKGFCNELTVGSSVSLDGVCLTVTALFNDHRAHFDVMLPTLKTTTLQNAFMGMKVNVERATKEGAEIGGHPLSGHIDFYGKIIAIQNPENNYSLTIEIPSMWIRYIFNKGYIALNGTSLTMSEVNKQKATFEVWLIPETLRRTTFDKKKVDDLINIELDRSTQVIVDTLRSAIEEQFQLLRAGEGVARINK